MDPNTPNTYYHYDVYFQDDRERYIRGYAAYEQFVAMCDQEIGGSGSGSAPKRTRTYIPRQREEAEQRLIDDKTPPKYPEENFRRRYRMSSTLLKKIVNDILSYDAQPLPDYFQFFRECYDCTGRKSIGPILKCTSAIRQLAYFGVPGANNDLNVLYGSPLFDDELAGTAPECPFEVNGHIYNKGYYLADGIYPTWSVFVKTFSVAKTEKTLKFKRIQESSRKDIERAFGVLQGRWGIIRQPARAFEINALKRIMYCCVMLHNMILEDEDFVVNLRDVFVDPTPDIPQEWTERCDLHVRKHKELRDSKVHNDLRDDLVEHVWNRNY
ncbi:ALP1-like protein isoform X1 [Tanacetum coccineum]